MGKIVLSIVLGLLSPLVFIIGAEPFEVRGQNSVQEIAGGCAALAIYLAICQFLVARRSEEIRTVFFAMTAPVLASFFLVVALERPHTVLVQGIPMLLAGSMGTLFGAWLARYAVRHRRASSSS